jgi:uncharacterized protein with PIN domain
MELVNAARILRLELIDTVYARGGKGEKNLRVADAK